jgi:glycine hydroxymethyltransferase
VEIEREELLRSLERQRRVFASSIVLTPVDSLPFCLADRDHTAFLHGLYLTDKVRDRKTALNTAIQFAGRRAAAEDIDSIHCLLAERLGAAKASLRLLAGLQAHAATFMSIARIGQSVMLLPEVAGGHFNSHAILERLGLRIIDMPVDTQRLCIDPEATLDLVQREQPDFLFVDRSEGLRYEDFSFLGQIEGPVKVFDASQYLTPIIMGRYSNPFDWGFDLMLFTLHKSFPGPQKAGIASREDDELWARLVKGLSTLVSSSHAENSYLTGLALLRRRWLDTYAQRLLDTAVALEEEMAQRGLAVIARDRQGREDWPATHHVWLHAPSREAAFTLYEELAEVGVLTNYRKLPYEIGYGLRLGTTFSAVAGIDPSHAAEIAEIVTAVTQRGPCPALRERVAELAREARRGAILPTRHWAPNDEGGATATGERMGIGERPP